MGIKQTIAKLVATLRATGVERGEAKRIVKAKQPKCKTCQGKLTWRDLLYGAKAHRFCKRCRHIIQRDRERGAYVSMSFAARNRANRRANTRARRIEASHKATSLRFTHGDVWRPDPRRPIVARYAPSPKMAPVTPLCPSRASRQQEQAKHAA